MTKEWNKMTKDWKQNDLKNDNIMTKCLKTKWLTERMTKKIKTKWLKNNYKNENIMTKAVTTRIKTKLL